MTEFAFPNSHLSHIKGMALRDYFAAAALPMAIQEMNEAESYDSSDAAIVAYQYADAMMKARQSND
ncbi:MAG: hypothetical protein WCK82_14985 [Bacteroidota bacterium]